MKYEVVGYAESSTRFRWRMGQVLEWRLLMKERVVRDIMCKSILVDQSYK